MDLSRVDRLNLHPHGSRVLTGGLSAQGLELSPHDRGPGMLLQHLLLRRKWNRRRRRREFGHNGTAGQSGGGRGGPPATGIRKYALRLRRNFRRGTDYLGLPDLFGVHLNRGAPNGLSRDE